MSDNRLLGRDFWSHAHADDVKAVLEAGADVTISNERGVTALHLAVNQGDYSTIALLLAYGADVNARVDGGYTPLFQAVRKGDAHIATLLLQHGADAKAQTKVGVGLLDMALQQTRDDLVALLIRYGADPNYRDTDQLTLLHRATIGSDRHGFERVKCLLEQGADVNALAPQGETCLHRVMRQYWHNEFHYKRMVALLLEHGADINAPDHSGRPPLFNLGPDWHGFSLVDIVKFFLEHGWHAHARDDNGATFVDYAVRWDWHGHHNFWALEQLLLDHGADSRLMARIPRRRPRRSASYSDDDGFWDFMAELAHEDGMSLDDFVDSWTD